MKNQDNSLFSIINPTVNQSIRNDTLSLHSAFWINGDQTQEVQVAFTSHYIALGEKSFQDYNYFVYTELDFELKFQVIYSKQNTPNTNMNSIFSTPIGFKLIRGSLPSVQFEIVSKSLLCVWLKYLTKTLNQVGFHNLFKPRRKLGKGGFATVYEVERLTDGKLFAVKAFSKQNTLNSKIENNRINLLNEISLMRMLNNPHVIKLQAVFQSESSLYIVLQLLTGGHLHSLINTRGGRFLLREVKSIMAYLATGLKELHDNKIAHRDIKPQNIMLRNGMQPVIADFGLAANVEWDDYVFYRCGTPGYVAPEVTTLEKGMKLSPVCDIFSAGAILHILLIGRPLFSGRRFEEVYQNNKKMRFNLQAQEYAMVDSQGMDLLQKMLKQRPEDRITASEMLKHPFLADQIIAEQKQVISPLTKVLGNKERECQKTY